MATIEVTFPRGEYPGKILKWKVRVNTVVAAGKVILLYQDVIPGKEDAKITENKLRASRFGCVTKLLAKEGDVVQPGQVIAMLEACKHPTVMKDMCAECGMDLRAEGSGNDGKDTAVSQASIPMLHSIPELKVCPELAEKIGKEDEERLLKDRKLALLVDLDQTIVHTTNDNIPPNMKDVYHYQLYGPHSPWYHTRLRPNTRHFLEEMSHLYELHICTFGARNYAHTVAALLDKDGVLFSHRILSRDECFDPASKTANLKALFPCGDDLVCIIDDREDVWQGCGNLVQVKPYHFFRHTGDIHAPPGLEKNDIPLMNTSNNFEPIVKNSEVENPETEKNGVIESTNDENEEAEKSEKTEGTEKSNDESPVEKDTEINVEKSIELDTATETKKSDKKDMEENVDKNTEPGTNEESSKSDTDIKTTEATDENREITESTKSDNVTSENKEDEKSEYSAKPTETKDQTTQQDASNVEQNLGDEDEDDYLLYLEDILRRIHTEFYSQLDAKKEKTSLRDIIPKVRSQVLKALCITFSGLIPTHQKLNESRAYRVAKSFGAEVTQDLTDKTTHLVAIKPGTAKVNAAKKNENIKIVNPDWLWTCAERWEHVDERLFPLSAKARGSRVPPPHCSSPERMVHEERETKFADSINPLMSFTLEEIEIMDKEVDEDMEEQETEPCFDSQDMEESTKRNRNSDSEDSTNDDDAYTSPKKKKRSEDTDDEDDDNNDNENDEDDEDDPATRFKRGEDLDDEYDLGDNSQDSVDDYERADDEDDREWNAMGAALEREFLSE